MLDFLGTLCLGALLIVGLLVIMLLMRFLAGRSDKPAGTYDSPDYDSGGSIGGMRGGRAYDSPDYDSGGTIGGQRHRRAHDHPEIRSGASIGGGPRAGDSPRPGAPSPGTWDTTQQDEGGYPTRKEDGRVDSPDIESGGSFGG
jgi:hypothetical protein